MSELSVRRITTATVFRLLFWGLLIGCVPIFSVLGVLGYFGLAAMTWNGQPQPPISIGYYDERMSGMTSASGP